MTYRFNLRNPQLIQINPLRNFNKGLMSPRSRYVHVKSPLMFNQTQFQKELLYQAKQVDANKPKTVKYVDARYPVGDQPCRLFQEQFVKQRLVLDVEEFQFNNIHHDANNSEILIAQQRIQEIGSLSLQDFQNFVSDGQERYQRELERSKLTKLVHSHNHKGD